MATEVVLNKDVSGIGVEGDIIRVADGFARNYLLPRKLATQATAIAKKKMEKIQQVREVRRVQEREAAQALAGRLEGVSCTIHAKVSDSNRLFGSVTAADIQAALEKQGITLAKNQIVLKEAIKALGNFTATLRLHADVETSIKVWVVEEKA